MLKSNTGGQTVWKKKNLSWLFGADRKIRPSGSLFLGITQHSLMRPNTGWPLVREKSGKFDFSSRSGKSQGILQIGQGIFEYQGQGIVKEFCKLVREFLNTKKEKSRGIS